MSRSDQREDETPQRFDYQTEVLEHILEIFKGQAMQTEIVYEPRSGAISLPIRNSIEYLQDLNNYHAKIHRHIVERFPEVIREMLRFVL